MTLEESNNETLTRAKARGLEDAHMREKFARWREELEAAEPSRPRMERLRDGMSAYDLDRISSQLLWITVELWILVMLVRCV